MFFSVFVLHCIFFRFFFRSKQRSTDLCDKNSTKNGNNNNEMKRRKKKRLKTKLKLEYGYGSSWYYGKTIIKNIIKYICAFIRLDCYFWYAFGLCFLFTLTAYTNSMFSNFHSFRKRREGEWEKKRRK